MTGESGKSESQPGNSPVPEPEQGPSRTVPEGWTVQETLIKG